MRPLHALVSLLRLDAKRGNRPSLEPADADGLVRLLTLPVGAVIDPMERSVDLGDQPAFARAGSQFDGMLGLE